jgi:glucose-6-phosphate 1-dehydrogenase
MRGDATLFARWDEVEYSWEFVDKIFEAWKNEDPHFPNYIPGTNGPASSDLLVSEDNHTWLDSSKEMDDENL